VRFFPCAGLQDFSAVRNLKEMFYESITPTQLAERLKNKEDFKFIDVREPQEYAVARIDAAELLPLTQFNEWVDTLKPEEEIVVMCHHGIRSANVCMFLVRNGFEKVFNLEGGIDSWSLEVDETTPRY
jgi:rhodanese-related sulfurtransferase